MWFYRLKTDCMNQETMSSTGPIGNKTNRDIMFLLTMSNQPHYWESPRPAAESSVVGRSTSIPVGAPRRKQSNAGRSEYFEDQIEPFSAGSWSPSAFELSFDRRIWEIKKRAGSNKSSPSWFRWSALPVLLSCMATLLISLMQSTDSSCCRVIGLQNYIDVDLVAACATNTPVIPTAN